MHSSTADALVRRRDARAGRRGIGLSWKPDYDAVRYEVQMKDDDGMFYDNQFVYANSVLLDKKGRLEHPENVSYRVRPIDFDGNPISAFTPYMPFEDGAFKDDRDAPYHLRRMRRRPLPTLSGRSHALSRLFLRLDARRRFL